ncbi:MAG: thioredoxin domain-containing protein [Dokdonella sp.]
MNEAVHVVCPVWRALNRVPSSRLAAKPASFRCHAILFAVEPMTLDASTFDDHIARDDLPVLSDFWETWCAPCRSMTPEFERAAKHLEPTCRLGKVDTEVQSDFAARFSIRSVPTLILCRGGREIARRSGALRAEQIERWSMSVWSSAMVCVLSSIFRLDVDFGLERLSWRLS